MTNKLLSDEELLAEIDVLTDNLLAYGIGVKDSYDTRIFDLINTQKRLYAESVIGEDEVVGEGRGSIHTEYILDRNVLRAELRERIK